jgi:hypothetical protein
MSTPRGGRAPAGERAWVLGGGGSTGNAWLIGVIAGLFDAGLDVTEAALIIGTPAGSTAAAQITTASSAADTSTAATDATRMRIWLSDTSGFWCCHHSAAEHGCRWSGACILQHRSTSYAPPAAESKRSSRIATPSTCSAPMRWICRCVGPPPSGLQPRLSACRAAHRIPALTPTEQSTR